MRHRQAVVGLPPAMPPVPPVLFVHALTRHDVSTAEGFGPRPRAHKQLGAWFGRRSYEGIILSFFKSVPAARASVETLASLYGGQRIRNVVVTWDQEARPSQSLRNTVLSCLRSKGAGRPGESRPPPQARLGTFVGIWGGHTRGLSIKASGRGNEGASDGCCYGVYQMTFQILSVGGTLTRATALYRVTSFRRHAKRVRKLHVGEIGKLRLRNGIVTNTLTQDFFCSNPAWGATNACGL